MSYLLLFNENVQTCTTNFDNAEFVCIPLVGGAVGQHYRIGVYMVRSFIFVELFFAALRTGKYLISPGDRTSKFKRYRGKFQAIGVLVALPV